MKNGFEKVSPDSLSGTFDTSHGMPVEPVSWQARHPWECLPTTMIRLAKINTDVAQYRLTYWVYWVLLQGLARERLVG